MQASVDVPELRPPKHPKPSAQDPGLSIELSSSKALLQCIYSSVRTFCFELGWSCCISGKSEKKHNILVEKAARFWESFQLKFSDLFFRKSDLLRPPGTAPLKFSDFSDRKVRKF